MNILNDMIIAIAVTVGGTVFIAAFLWLATFPRHNIQIVAGTWLSAGMFCALIYLALALRFTRSSSIMMFLSAVVIGVPQFMFLRFWEPTNKRFRWWGLYIVWLYLWIATLIGGRYGLLGLLIITLPAVLIAGLGLFFVAGVLLPFPAVELYRGKRAAPAANPSSN